MSLDKITRREFIGKSFKAGLGLAVGYNMLSNALCSRPDKPHNGNGNDNGIEYKILTTWKANYTLEGTEATGKVRYYQGGSYTPDTDSGTKVAEANLGEQVELGSAKEGQTVPFDVVVEADNGLRKVYKNVSMSKTATYNDNKEGVLKLTDFNLDDYIHYWLDPRNEGIRVINRWNQDTIASEFNPDISASTLSGQTLFNMTSDFMPSKDELKRGMTYRRALERGVNRARNILRGRKYVLLYDGSDFDNRGALIKWANYLQRNIGSIAEIKDLHQAQYEGLDKIAAQGYNVLQLNAKRLSDPFIDEIIKWLKHVKDLSNGVIKNFPEPIRNGNRTAADLPPPDGASWSFYDSEHQIGNGIYPVGGDVVNSHEMRYNSDILPLSAVQHETFDAFFRSDQDHYFENIDDWIKFSFMRPAGGAEGHKITENYETRNGVASNVSVQSGTLQAVEVNYSSYGGDDTLSRMGSLMGPSPIKDKRVVRDLSPREEERYVSKKKGIKK